MTLKLSPRLCVYVVVLLSLVISVPAGQPTLAQSSPGLATLPPRFADEVAVPGLLAPRAFVFAPDGRILILERGTASSNDINGASIRVVKDGVMLATRALSIQTCGDSERGALGLALDVNFSTNGYLYVYYTRYGPNPQIPCDYDTHERGIEGPRNRISRFTMVGDTINPASQRILVDNIVTDVGYHNAGDLHVDSNGYLYASTGDGGVSSLAADPATLNGKILRILPTDSDPRGYVTTGNPYDNAPEARYCGLTPQPTGDGPCREVFAMGFRNPFRFTLQDGTNIPFVGDVGGGVWEEIDLVVPGGHYGWALREGPCGNGSLCSPPYNQPPGLTNPIYAYSHIEVYANQDSAVIGGDFYPGGNYPDEYDGDYFFTDAVRGFIGRLKYNSTTDSWSAQPEFASGGAGIIGLKANPFNGDLYYITYISDSSTRIDALHRIRYVEGNNIVPNAQASITTPGTPGNPTYTFSAAGSTDPDGDLPLSYTWDLGDGTEPVTTGNVTVTHTYTQSINRTVTLTVTDNAGGVSVPATLTVYPGNAPATAEIVLENLTQPSLTTTYHAGDTWAYSIANAVDPDGPSLPNSAYNWAVVFHHQDHTHPFLPSLDGTSGEFTIPVSGETDPVVWYRVILEITDARGEVSTIQRDVTPLTAEVTLTTNPPGGLISLEGGSFTSPHVITRVIGLRTTIGVPSPQTIGGVDHAFESWSDGGPQTHTLTVPATDSTVTAYLSPTLLSAPLVAPGRNYSIISQPTLSWGRVSWAAAYEVEVDDTNRFSSPLVFSDRVSNGELSVTTSALANGIYYWRVRACPEAGQCGAWSRTEVFVVNVSS